MLLQGAIRRLLIPVVMAWTWVGTALTCLARTVGSRYMRCHALVFSRADEGLVAFARSFVDAALGNQAKMTSPPPPQQQPPPPLPRRRARNIPRGLEDDSPVDDRAWGDMAGRRDNQLAQHRTDRVNYFVYAQMYEMDPSHPQHEPSPSLTDPHPAPPFPSHDPRSPFTSARPSTAGVASHLHGIHPSLGQRPRRPVNFTAEEQHYLHSRLPIRQPATAETAVHHFRRLPFLYSDLAEGYRLRLSHLPRDTAEWQRRRKMAALAQSLAGRYNHFRLILPRSYIEKIISRNQNEPRASKFWEKVLDEVERVNKAWALVPLWVLIFAVQSSLVAVAFQLLPSTGQLALLLANGLAYLWSTTVMCEMMHHRYAEFKADEQELHDLMGGLLRPL